jgi:hypothetical protein
VYSVLFRREPGHQPTRPSNLRVADRGTQGPRGLALSSIGRCCPLDTHYSYHSVLTLGTVGHDWIEGRLPLAGPDS